MDTDNADAKDKQTNMEENDETEPTNADADGKPMSRLQKLLEIEIPAWGTAVVPRLEAEGDSEVRRSSKRMRRQKETFDPGTVKSHSGANGRKRSSSSQFSSTSNRRTEEEDKPWPILEKIKEDGLWNEAEDSKATVLVYSPEIMCQIIKAVDDYFEKNDSKLRVDWDFVSKENNFGGRAISANECQALWKLAAYGVNEKGTIGSKYEKKQDLSSSSLISDDSDVDENLKPGFSNKLVKESSSSYCPRPPYVRYNSEEAWEDTGLPKVSMGPQCLPTYNWKNDEDFDVITAVLAKNTDDWEIIKKELPKIPLRGEVIRKRFVHLVNYITEKRYKATRVVERMELLLKTYSGLVKRIVNDDL